MSKNKWRCYNSFVIKDMIRRFLSYCFITCISDFDFIIIVLSVKNYLFIYLFIRLADYQAVFLSFS